MQQDAALTQGAQGGVERDAQLLLLIQPALPCGLQLELQGTQPNKVCMSVWCYINSTSSQENDHWQARHSFIVLSG